MDQIQNKVMDLRSAIDRYVKTGSHISVGGFTLNRNPMAAVHEIIRQKIKNLHIYAHSNGQAVDELIGAGCISKVEIAYSGTGRFAPTCIRFKKAVQDGSIRVEDYSNYQMSLRFLAGSMGVPFLPTRSSLGTDIIDKWGFTEQMRRKDQRIPDKKLVVTDNPFGNWTGSKKIVLVPAINPDVTIIHAQKCDYQGTVRIEGLTFADVEQVRSAKSVIVTCEELVEPDELRENPDLNKVPFICVDAVVHIPYGAYPTACYRYYDYDPAYLNSYKDAAGNEAGYQAYLEKYIFDMKNHQELIDRIGKKRIQMIKANPKTGYAKGLDRK